jgi:glycosyltransferase involved in cell wall biosynthesis
MSKRIEKPVISILMAVYNAEEFLSEAIDSVINQTYAQWELICINDGSSDNSLHILKQYQEKDARIIVLDPPRCGTAAGARNAGLAIARGQFIAMLDSDDKIESTYFEKLLARKYETQADIVISTTAYWEYKSNTLSRSLTGVYGDTIKMLSGREAFELSLHWEIGGIGLHLADTVKKIKYCEIGMRGDEYTTRVLFLLANKIAFSDAIYFYRNNLNSSTKRLSVMHYSASLRDAMLLTLIRENNFDRNLVINFKEEVISSLYSICMVFIKKRRLLTPNERKIAFGFLKTATIHIAREFFSAPFSVKSIFRMLYKLLKKVKIKIQKSVLAPI